MAPDSSGTAPLVQGAASLVLLPETIASTTKAEHELCFSYSGCFGIGSSSSASSNSSVYLSVLSESCYFHRLSGLLPFRLPLLSVFFPQAFLCSLVHWPNPSALSVGKVSCDLFPLPLYSFLKYPLSLSRVACILSSSYPI